MKNSDLSIKILLQKCETAIVETLVLENYYKIVVTTKAKQFYTNLGLYQQC